MLARTSNFAQQFVLQRVLICYNKKHDAITISLLNEYFFFLSKCGRYVLVAIGDS